MQLKSSHINVKWHTCSSGAVWREIYSVKISLKPFCYGWLDPLCYGEQGTTLGILCKLINLILLKEIETFLQAFDRTAPLATPDKTDVKLWFKLLIFYTALTAALNNKYSNTVKQTVVFEMFQEYQPFWFFFHKSRPASAFNPLLEYYFKHIM